MPGFAAPDFAVQAADTSGIDADARTLGNVFHNCAGGSIDGIQAVVAVFPDEVAEFVVEVLVAATLVYYAKGRLKTRYDFRRPCYRFYFTFEALSPLFR